MEKEFTIFSDNHQKNQIKINFAIAIFIILTIFQLNYQY